MATLSEEQARSYITKLLTATTRAGGSDLFISKDFPPSIKSQGNMQPLATQKLGAEITRRARRDRTPSSRRRGRFA
jgi:twitching motility protein PilU